MGYLFGRGRPAVLVTAREYLRASGRAAEALADEARRRDGAYREALASLDAGQPGPAARVFSSLLARRPGDASLHRRLGICYLTSGEHRRAARHLETALWLLARAERPGIPLVQTFQIEFEAGLVRLALAIAYERLGHRAGTLRCLGEGGPLGWRP